MTLVNIALRGFVFELYRMKTTEIRAKALSQDPYGPFMIFVVDPVVALQIIEQTIDDEMLTPVIEVRSAVNLSAPRREQALGVTEFAALA